MTDAPLDPSLARFFDTMAPYLRGESSVEAVNTVLGASPSGSTRVDFYRQLMSANFQRVLSHLFPAVQTTLSDPSRWTQLCGEYRLEHPSIHWDLNQFGASFSTFLSGKPALLDRHPALDQLAEYEFLFFEISRSTVHFDPAADGVNATTVIRQYTHQVPQCARAARGGPAAALEAAPMTVLVYRHPEDLRVRYLQPDMPMLLAYACLIGEANTATCAEAGISRAASLQGTQTLISSAVLGQPALAQIESLWG